MSFTFLDATVFAVVVGAVFAVVVVAVVVFDVFAVVDGVFCDMFRDKKYMSN